MKNRLFQQRSFVEVTSWMILWLILFSGAFRDKGMILQPTSYVRVNFTEPSDLLYLDGSDEFLVLGDKAFLYRVNRSGERIGVLDVSGFDLEAICEDDQNYYVSEETYQTILVIDKKTGVKIKDVPFKHAGGRNEGIEAMVKMEDNTFLLATEKDPQIFFVCNNTFEVQETFHIEEIGEVSGMCYSNNKLYVLSDEEETIYEVDMRTRKVIRQWRMNVVNPEGIAMSLKKEIFIACDDMARIYTYSLPQ